MREIKFRGKNYGGIWLYGYLMPAEKPVINKGCKYRISVSPQACAGKDKIVYEVITDTIGQFTGLQDKNGKEIYEGDIIIEKLKRSRNDGERLIVCFEEFEWKGKNASGATTSLSLLAEYHTINVIGNIHDNPELLESLV